MENLDLIQFVKPELFAVMLIVYLVGIMLKHDSIVKDKYIPLILSLISFVLCLFYFLFTMSPSNVDAVLEAIFTSFIQGILITACTVYGNQMFKQLKKKEE